MWGLRPDLYYCVPCASDRPRTTSRAEVACSLSRHDKTTGSYGTALLCGGGLAVGTFHGILSSLARLLGKWGGLWFLIPQEVTDG
jgi:hypothetical protein